MVTRPMLNYFGGKWNCGDWVVSHLPEHGIYVEVFGGGLSVFMKKPRAKCEVINDKEARIVNIYKQIRENSEKLEFLLKFTPFSRKEFRECQTESADPLEDARREICALAMGVGHSLTELSSGFRNSKKSTAAPSASFRSYVESFSQFHERIKESIIENLDWREMLEKYDDEQALFYLDPPYVHASRTRSSNYTFEMTDSDHLDLVNKIQGLKAMVVLSGYENEIYQSLNWHKEYLEVRTQNNGNAKECLWLCPKVMAKGKQILMQLI